jgi:hypothetical protein
MKKNWVPIAVIILCLSFAACSGGSGKKSASSIAKEWCDLNGKAHKAADGPEKVAAKAALDKYETDMEAKYKGDEAFMKEIENEVEKCEDASEGK